MADGTCSVGGCNATMIVARGYCRMHYERWKRNGDPGPATYLRTPGLSVEERFWAKVEKTDGCWLWRASMAYGYGRFAIKSSRILQAHRFAYELLVGPIPDGLQLDHLCRNPACVNPSHLEPVTGRENVLRGNTFAARQAAITHCPAGHAYDEANTRVDARGCRHCRACQRIRAREIRGERRRLAA